MEKANLRLGIDASSIRAGGGLTHLYELLSAMHPEHFGVYEIAVWSGHKTLKQLPSRSWLTPQSHPWLDRSMPFRVLWQAFVLPRSTRGQYDVLFVPGGSYVGNLKPYVAMSQNLLPFDSLERHRFFPSWTWLRLVLLEISQRYTFQRAAGMVFLTQTAYQVISSKVSNLPRQVIIPHGVDSRFRRSPCTQKPISSYSFDKPFTFCYVSIINAYKHQWYVAEAVARLRQIGLPVALDLIGPVYEPSWQRLKQTLDQLDPLGQFIRYLGQVPFEDLHVYYHQADAFIFASSCENLPNILIEAMSAGLPIACSDRGPMPEVLGDAGIYFNPENLDSIAAALETLIVDPSRRSEYAWAAYHRAEQYSWQRCADDTLAFLTSVARGEN